MQVSLSRIVVGGLRKATVEGCFLDSRRHVYFVDAGDVIRDVCWKADERFIGYPLEVAIADLEGK